MIRFFHLVQLTAMVEIYLGREWELQSCYESEEGPMFHPKTIFQWVPHSVVDGPVSDGVRMGTGIRPFRPHAI